MILFLVAMHEACKLAEYLEMGHCIYFILQWRISELDSRETQVSDERSRSSPAIVLSHYQKQKGESQTFFRDGQVGNTMTYCVVEVIFIK